jgi:nucleoside-diphosphate-sugar epimerase
MSAAGYELRGIYGTEPYWPEKKLKICVTGAGGFIASHLAKRLKEEGHHVVGCDWKRNEHMPVRQTRLRSRIRRGGIAPIEAARAAHPTPRASIHRPSRRRRAFRRC